MIIWSKVALISLLTINLGGTVSQDKRRKQPHNKKKKKERVEYK